MNRRKVPAKPPKCDAALIERYLRSGGKLEALPRRTYWFSRPVQWP